MTFSELQITQPQNMVVNTLGWTELPDMLGRWRQEYHLMFAPRQQQYKAWSFDESQAYLAYVLAGNTDTQPVLLARFKHESITRLLGLDGEQRLSSIERFMTNTLPVNGNYYRDFTDALPYYGCIRYIILDFHRHADALKWTRTHMPEKII